MSVAVASAAYALTGRRRRRVPCLDKAHPRRTPDMRMPQPDSDAATADAGHLVAWLGEVADGDRDAFERLYRATSNKLFGVCVRLLRDRAEAEDALQDVFATIWHKAGQYDAARASAITWLAQIARNRCIDRLRSAAHLRRHDAIDLAEEIPDDAPGTVEQAERAGDRERLEACMDELDANRSKLLRTAFFEGVTYEELARRSDTPLGTVKSWIRRSLTALRACLER